MRTWLPWLVLLPVAFATAPAPAQPATEADAAPPAAGPCTEEPHVCGRLAFEAGIQAFEQGEYQIALERFREAQAIKPHPIILFNVALAEAEVGLLVEAERHFDEVFRDTTTPAEKLDAARRERDRVAALVATVGVDREDAQLLVDGQVARGSPPSARVNPGAHHVQVLLGAQVMVDREVDLGRGEKLRLAVAVADAEPEPEPEPVPEPVLPPPERDESSGLSPAWVYAGAGLTAVLAGVTVWSGLDASAAYDEFESDAPNLSDAEARDRVDEGEGKDLRTNLLLGATVVVGLATGGLALFAVDWKAGESRDSRGMSLQLWPGRLSVAARF